MKFAMLLILIESLLLNSQARAEGQGLRSVYNDESNCRTAYQYLLDHEADCPQTIKSFEKFNPKNSINKVCAIPQDKASSSYKKKMDEVGMYLKAAQACEDYGQHPNDGTETKSPEQESGSH